MESVVSDIKCPRCGSEALNDYYYKTGEKVTHCTHCGYTYETFYKRDEQGKLILRDPSKGEEFSNLTMEIKEAKEPYACFSMRPKGSIGAVIGPLLSIGDREEFIENIKGDEEIYRGVIVSRYNPSTGEIEEEYLIREPDEEEPEEEDIT